MQCSPPWKVKPNGITRPVVRRVDLSPKKILEQMDVIYRMSVSFQDLNVKLCGLKQGPNESPKDYYECMVDVSVALKEYHGDQFQLGELAWMKKDCFYTGLQENYKYLVSQLKDQEDCDPVFMLKEIQESDESWHLVSSSNPLKMSRDEHGKTTCYHDKKTLGHYDKHGHGAYAVRTANVCSESEESLLDVDSESDVTDPQQDSSYHIGMMNMAVEVEDFFDKWNNCDVEGQPCWDCKQPLKPSLKVALKTENE